MKIFEVYRKILNECYNKPPRNVPDIWIKIQEKYPVSIEYIYKDNEIIGCCTLVKINKGFYGISWVSIEPEHQKQGYGTKLMNKITDKYKGVFITKTNSARGFYNSLGWREIGLYEGDYVFCYINDIEKIDF